METRTHFKANSSEQSNLAAVDENDRSTTLASVMGVENSVTEAGRKAALQVVRAKKWEARGGLEAARAHAHEAVAALERPGRWRPVLPTGST